MVKKTRKKSFRKKQKGGVCERYDKQGTGICSNNAKACCNAKPLDQRLCHFNDALKEDVKNNGYKNSKIYTDMQREHKEYHDEENKHADLIFNVTGFRNNGEPIYDKSKYKDEVGQEGEDILNKITVMRNAWLEKYYRKACYDCDGNCREHNRRARSADFTARASEAQRVLNARDADRKVAATNVLKKFDIRFNFKANIKREIAAGEFAKAKIMLDDWRKGGIGTGSGMSEKQFKELEKKILENLKVSAEGGASSKKRGRRKSRRIRKSRKKLRSRKSRKNKKSRKSRRRSAVRRRR